MVAPQQFLSLAARIFAVIVMLFAGTALRASAQQIWLAPPDNLPRGSSPPYSTDFPRLFDTPGEWSFAASHVAVLSLAPYYVSAAPEPELRKIFAFLKDHHIGLNITLMALPVDGCGRGIEGLVQSVNQPLFVIERAKKFGADLQSVAVDGPIGFGHIYKGKNACGYSVAEVAHRLAATIDAVRKIYPAVKMYEWEGPTDLPLAEWTAALDEYLADYRKETGTPLDGLAMDVNWHKPWREAAPPTIELAHRHGVKAGSFLDATGGPSVTDESWLAEAKQNMQDVEAAKLGLDFVVIATWMFHPQRNLPETDPLTFTSLVDWYVKQLPARR